MNSRQNIAKKSSEKSWLVKLHLQPAWTAIIGLFLVVAILLLISPRLLVPIFPLASMAVGVLLYRRYPILYVGFTWWMWFVAPLIRRLIDYRCGYNTVGPFELAPMLISSISLVTLIRYLPRIYNRDGLPFVLCFGSVLYGFIVGLIRQTTVDYDHEIIIALGWFSPMLFGFHLFLNWQHYPSYRQNIQRVFFWGVLVMGIYGVFQFIIAPEWDKFFIINSLGTYYSWMGVPEPLGMRVWSTVTTPFTFGAVIMPGLVLLLISKEKLRYVSAGFGYLAFLLAQARTAWGSLVVAIAIFVLSLRSSHQIRVIVSIALVVIIALPLINIEPFSEVIATRLKTFQDIGNDGSFQNRVGQLTKIADYALTEFVGWGLIGYEGIPANPDPTVDLKDISATDNGYLSILISLGWLGLIPYVIGIGLLFLKSFSNYTNSSDSFATAAKAIALGSFARLMSNNITFGLYGIAVWAFLGISMAANKYHLSQRTNQHIQDIQV